MQPGDLAAFRKLADALFAAFDKTPSDARMEAYWRGLKSMDLLAFERTIEVVIGPHGEDELPTPKQLYAIDRKRRAELRAAELAGRAPKTQAEATTDVFDDYTGRVLFGTLCKLICQHSSAATDDSLAQMIHVKHDFAKGYREQCKTEPEAEAELRDHLIAALTRCFVPRDAPSQPSEPPKAPVPGSTWQRLMDDLAKSNSDEGHNAPIGSEHWRLPSYIPRP